MTVQSQSDDMVSSVMREKKERPIVKIAVTVIAMATLFILVSSFFYHLNADSYDFSRSELLIVPTDSMDGGPTEYEISTIPKDSMIMVHLLSSDEKDDLKVGDVITFYQDGMYKVHRITAIDGNLIVTKGDASKSYDNPILKKDVVGKVIGVSIVVGDIISTVSDLIRNQGLLLFIALVIIIVMYYEIRVVISILKEDKESQGD